MVFLALFAGVLAYFQCCLAWRLMLPSVMFAYVAGSAGREISKEEGANSL